MHDQVPSQERLLLAMIPLQQATGRLLLATDELKRQGDLPAALASYEELISTCRAHLALAEQNSSLYPESPYDIPPIVNPLLDALLVQADLREHVGDRARAEAQREEALNLADKYLKSAS